MTADLLLAALLGLVEGATEFIPVSSTAHLLILTDLLGFNGPAGHTFEIFIQLGAILAVVVLYWPRFWDTLTGLPRRDPAACHFAGILIVGTIPALIAGAALYPLIKHWAYDQPLLMAATLIAGGLFILAFERLLAARTATRDIDRLPLRSALLIGCAQAVALIPGVSRSGASIMGGLALGLPRRAAAEFSFFLAVPTMTAGVAFDLYKSWGEITLSSGWPLLATGFACAFATALAVMRTALAIVDRWGFAPFAYYRLLAGAALIAIYA
ncbi:MAG TPA: undecaprenyl-diphosphatase [Rhodospirillaceae bacterium]|nr:undecaprenyl-diphosphate phosphatase [Alphaproteobacteria bacterium]HBH27178.1 undecaprenyl-diphosphatase [Rhodospirillaceae bacterium]